MDTCKSAADEGVVSGRQDYDDDGDDEKEGDDVWDVLMGYWGSSELVGDGWM